MPLFRCVVSQFAETMLAHVLASPNCSAALHVFVAQYVRTYRSNKHVELLHISTAEVGR